MKLTYPFMVVFAIMLTVGVVGVYAGLSRRRSAAMRASGLVLAGKPGSQAVRRHLPYLLFLASMPILLFGLAKPYAEVPVPRASGTVILVFDVSASMRADDVKPNRLAAAKEAAGKFIEAQPSTVDIGVVIFGQDGLTTQRPTANKMAVNDAIARLTPNGGTSLRQAILAAMTAITGKNVALPDPDSNQPAPDIGYWRSATIVLFSDGEDTTGPGAEEAAELASDAGVRIETVGIGTVEGATMEVDGYQVATALDEELLTTIAALTGGSYHPAGDAATLNDIHRSIDLRITTQPENVELTAFFAAVALLFLTIGGLLMIRWHGRIV